MVFAQITFTRINQLPHYEHTTKVESNSMTANRKENTELKILPESVGWGICMNYLCHGCISLSLLLMNNLNTHTNTHIQINLGKLITGGSVQISVR